MIPPSRPQDEKKLTSKKATSKFDIINKEELVWK